MAGRSLGADLQTKLNILIASGVVGHLTDGQILRRFLSDDHGEAEGAFTALVDRHGPMVLGVCREILGDSHDADDAFQAAFLVLFRRAGSVRDADSVASWLHGVALRVARRARSDAVRAMLWTKLMTGALAGLALATLTLSARAALAYQDTKKAGQAAALPKAPKEPVTPVVRPAEPAKFPDSSGIVIVSLPPRAELHQLLRRASSEATVVAKTKPESLSWTLTTIAAAQAKAGDVEGACATFAVAVKEAAGGFGGPVSLWNLWRIGHVQAGCGKKDEARATLQAAVKALPGLVGDFQDDIHTVDTFAVIVQDQARIGARADAHKTVELLLEPQSDSRPAVCAGGSRTAGEDGVRRRDLCRPQ